MRLVQQAAAIRLANFFGWSVQEVRECVDRIDPTNLKVLKNLSQLDLLMRVRELSIETGMDALTIFLIGSLPETIDKTAYAKAAELALLGATSERAPVAHVASDLNELVSITCDVVDDSDVVANKPGELATYRVTVKNAQGQPLSGIKVHWRASLGSIKTGATDTNGTLLVIYTPGKVMGTDTPMYWLDLFEPRYATSIDITFDRKTLTFPLAELSPTPLGVVPEGQEVELYALLEDFYGNRAYDSLVDWYWETVPPKKWIPRLSGPVRGSPINRDSRGFLCPAKPEAPSFSVFGVSLAIAKAGSSMPSPSRVRRYRSKRYRLANGCPRSISQGAGSWH